MRDVVAAMCPVAFNTRELSKKDPCAPSKRQPAALNDPESGSFALYYVRAPNMRDVHGPRLNLLGGIKWLVPLGLWLLIGFFYLAAFFAQHTPFEAAVLVFLALSVLAGLLEATSVPAAVPVLLFD